MLAHAPVVDDVQVDDRRAPEPRPRGRTRRQQRLQQRRGAGVRHGHDHGVAVQLPLGARDHERVAVALHALRAPPEPRIDARLPERASRRLGDRLGERSRVKADVPRVGARQQPRLKHERAQQQRG